MASSKKSKSVSQHIVHLATPGMPKVVKNTLGNRLMAPITIAAVATFVASGIITIDWSGGWPRLSIDRQRVAKIEDVAKQTKNKLQQLPVGQRQSPEARTLPVSTNLGHLTTGQSSRNQQSSSTTIRIASFNIQVFGTSKMKKQPVMDVLAKTIRKFDVVAVQELRTTDTSVVPSFVTLINSTGRAYEYVIGPRLGRTNSKEQYLFIYDSQRIEIDPSSVTTIPDPQDLLHREPLAARFRARTSPSSQGFTFILINIHTDPDETKTELDALGDVFQMAQRNPWREDDVILLGDLNVNHKKLGKLGAIPDITYTVHGEPTNTRRTKSYDNLVFCRTPTLEFTGSSGIVDLETEFGLTREQALEVSDHLPVWGEFHVMEHGQPTPANVPPTQIASQPQQSTQAAPSPAPPHRGQSPVASGNAQMRSSTAAAYSVPSTHAVPPNAPSPYAQPARPYAPAYNTPSYNTPSYASHPNVTPQAALYPQAAVPPDSAGSTGEGQVTHPEPRSRRQLDPRRFRFLRRN